MVLFVRNGKKKHIYRRKPTSIYPDATRVEGVRGLWKVTPNMYALFGVMLLKLLKRIIERAAQLCG